ncbi:MAG: hypothetical protein MUD12_15490 [Spirochaetes bacterium]|nr:hypothetical protein [Spirochaetota bacterium]
MKRIILEQDDRPQGWEWEAASSRIELLLEAASGFGKGMEEGIFIAFWMFLIFMIMLFIFL